MFFFVGKIHDLKLLHTKTNLFVTFYQKKLQIVTFPYKKIRNCYFFEQKDTNRYFLPKKLQSLLFLTITIKLQIVFFYEKCMYKLLVFLKKS